MYLKSVHIIDVYLDWWLQGAYHYGNGTFLALLVDETVDLKQGS